MKNKNKKISVVIVTKNRWKHLAHCLLSLKNQSLLPTEVVVIDNCSSDLTPTLIKVFSKKNIFPIKYYKEKRVGYPVIYNRGLKEAMYPWVAFIDDDCVACHAWFENISLSVYDGVDVVIGSAETYHKEKIVSLLVHFFNQYWKEKGMVKGKITDYEVLDNKNIVYKKSFLKKHHLQYDESRVDYDFGSSEDSDLGMQIWKSGGQALYSPQIKIFHKDPTSFMEHIRKILNRDVGHAQYEQKWKQEREALPKNSLDFIRFFINYVKKRRLSVFKSLIIFFMVLLTVLIMFLKKIRPSANI